MERQIAEWPQADPSVRSMVRTVTPTVETPTPAEMRRLFSIVSARWPNVRVSGNPDEALALFTRAFSYLNACVSHAEKRSKWTQSTWCDRAADYLRVVGQPSDMKPTAIALACATLGFEHSPLVGSPTSWDLWITQGNHRPAGSTYWKALLNGGPMREPVEQDSKKWNPADNRVRIEGGNSAVGEHKGWVEPW